MNKLTDYPACPVDQDGNYHWLVARHGYKSTCFSEALQVNSPPSRRLSILPEGRFDSQFVHFVDQHNDVVTYDLAQRLIHHCRVGLAAE